MTKEEMKYNIAITLILTAFQSGVVGWIKQDIPASASLETLFYAYLSMFFIVALTTTQKVDYFYGERLDAYTIRHLKWNLTHILITFAYILIGNTPMAIVVAILMAIFQKALFYGPEEKPMTWAELSQLLKPAK